MKYNADGHTYMLILTRECFKATVSFRTHEIRDAFDKFEPGSVEIICSITGICNTDLP